MTPYPVLLESQPLAVHIPQTIPPATLLLPIPALALPVVLAILDGGGSG